MKIVIVDGFTANPGDLSWASLEGLGSLEIHDRTSPSELLERVQDAEAILTNKVVLNAETLGQLPHLRYIGVLATGYNIVDTTAAKTRGIPVCNVPEYGTANVAQAVFSLLLELTNRTGHHAQLVREGRWSQCQDFCFWEGSLVELSGLTLGIVGYGRIGQAVARVGRALGMKILACRRNGPVEEGGTDFETLMKSSDVVSLHCPLTPETKELIQAKTLEWMKPTAYLINTARGPLIHEQDLADCLNSGRIAGAGLDVLCVEPPASHHPLIGAKNCVVTPHIAWATRSARARLIQAAANNLRAFQQGCPQNVVNG